MVVLVGFHMRVPRLAGVNARFDGVLIEAVFLLTHV